jgi:hypothetical protein
MVEMPNEEWLAAYENCESVMRSSPADLFSLRSFCASPQVLETGLFAMADLRALQHQVDALLCMITHDRECRAQEQLTLQAQLDTHYTSPVSCHTTHAVN